MIERAIGADVFQKGVRAYLAKHACGNATYDDFVGAMTEAAGKDLQPLFDAFVHAVAACRSSSFELACDKGAAPKLALDAAPLRADRLGDRSEAHLEDAGVRAVGHRHDDRPRLHDARRRDRRARADRRRACPDWVLPNEGELGYYRMLPQGKLLDQLLAHVQGADAARARRR